jgi:predicted NAD-dependent protein-ADP-ribosyltransferase YbiA (DUF1768 family)
MEVSVKMTCVVLLVLLLSIVPGCEQPEPQKAVAKSPPHYPAHWREPVSKEGAPDWEIMPQEAKSGEVILSKRKELGLLSNFAATPFEYHGRRYASLEGFWQMMKFPEGPDDPRAKFPGLKWNFERDAVGQMTGFEAKRAGDVGSRNMQKMGIDWVTFESKQMPYKPKEPGEHYRLIEDATRAKVDQNPEVKRVLLATGDLILKPDHKQEKDAPAAWRYYDILMKIRGELQKQSGQSPPRTSPTTDAHHG